MPFSNSMRTQNEVHRVRGFRQRHLRLLFLSLVFSLMGDRFCTADLHDLCREATVRIRNGSSMGSGTVFRENADAFYVLTNAHVAGTRLGNRVNLEFWHRGHQSRSVIGETVAVAYLPGNSRDIAVVRVDRQRLGQYVPPVIPLADETTGTPSGQVFSVGCPSGRWPTAFDGYILDESASVDRDLLQQRTVRFVPMPAGGRSGSALFSFASSQPTIVGLIAWRSTPEGGHGLDGRNETHGHGIAMTHYEVRSALKGRRVPSSDPTRSESPMIPLAWSESPHPRSGEGDLAEIRPSSENEESVLLQFSDEDAVGGGPRVSSNSARNAPATDAANRCPGGQCPLPDGDPLFPSLPPEPESPHRKDFGEAPQVPRTPESGSWKWLTTRWLPALPWLVVLVLFFIHAAHHLGTSLRLWITRWLFDDTASKINRSRSVSKRVRKATRAKK